MSDPKTEAAVARVGDGSNTRSKGTGSPAHDAVGRVPVKYTRT